MENGYIEAIIALARRLVSAEAERDWYKSLYETAERQRKEAEADVRGVPADPL